MLGRYLTKMYMLYLELKGTTERIQYLGTPYKSNT